MVNFVDSAATTRSPERARLMPPPAAIPLTAITTGLAARAERLPRPRDHDAPHRPVLVGLERGVEEVAPQGQIQRVVRLRPIQRDRPDPLLHLIPHRLIAHGGHSP